MQTAWALVWRTLGAIGAGVGVGSPLKLRAACRPWAATPMQRHIIQTNMILGMAFAEAVAIYALAVSLIIVFAA